MAKRPKPLTDEELASIVDGQIQDADLYESGNVSSDGLPLREWALRFMEGEVDLPSMGEGRSSVVSRDISDTHGILLPGLMRTFFASGNVVEYEPTKTAHEAYADLATRYVNWVVMREGEGYREFRNAFHDGLLLGNGIIKHWWDDTPEYEIDEFTGLDEEGYALILAEMGPDDEILEHEEYPDPGALAAMGIEPVEDGEPDEATGAVDDDATGEELVDGPDDAVEADDGDDEPDEGSGAPMPPMPPPQAMQAPQSPMPAPMPGMDPAMGQPAPMQALMGALGGMGQPGMMQPMEPPAPPMLHDLKIRRLVRDGKLCLVCIPSEEFIIERGARCIDETVRFCAHKYEATRSDLIKQGFDPDIVDELPTYTDLDEEDDIRDRYRLYGEKAPDRSTEKVEVYECYVLVDADGDGIAERRRVVVAGQSGGRRMLADEAWEDEVPFSDIVPDPRPHTWRGRGLYDKLADIQRRKTVLERGTMDNIYDVLLPASQAAEGAYTNPDALYDRKFGEVLLFKRGTQPSDLLQPIVKEFIAPQITPMMEYLDTITEKRTGVSVRSQSQNVDVLQNQSATAAQIAQSAMAAKVDEYAQNIAQMGMARIFRCVLKLFTRHQSKPRILKLAGKEVEVDPRAWDASMHVVVNTGLGTGSRDRDVQALMAVANEQKLIIGQAGPWNDTGVHLGKLFDTLRKMAEATGLRTADSAFPQITDEEAQQRFQAMQQAAQGQQQMNPAMMQAQAEMQVEQMKAQARMQLDQQKAQFEAQMDMAKMQAEAQLQREREAAKLEFQAQMNQMQMMLKAQMQDAEIRMMEREAALRADLQRREMELEAMLTREANVMREARVVQNPVADTNIRGY